MLRLYNSFVLPTRDSPTILPRSCSSECIILSISQKPIPLCLILLLLIILHLHMIVVNKRTLHECVIISIVIDISIVLLYVDGVVNVGQLGSLLVHG